MPKYKSTGCARLGMFLLILLPIAYFGAQYLQKNGTLDSLQEKIDQKTDKGGDTFDEFDHKTSTPKQTETHESSNQDDVIRQQQERIRELEAAMKRKNSQNTTTIQDQYPERKNDEAQWPSSERTTNGTTPLEDLFEDYDRKTGNKHSTGLGDAAPPPLGDTGAPRESLASWNFTFGQMSGQIEFFTQGDRLYSRVHDGRQSNDYEMEKRNGRYYVLGSPTGEYYELKPNGDLDAFDQNGFQTTCRRAR